MANASTHSPPETGRTSPPPGLAATGGFGRERPPLQTSLWRRRRRRRVCSCAAAGGEGRGELSSLSLSSTLPAKAGSGAALWWRRRIRPAPPARLAVLMSAKDPFFRTTGLPNGRTARLVSVICVSSLTLSVRQTRLVHKMDLDYADCLCKISSSLLKSNG